jgi:hypothetical protein
MKNLKFLLLILTSIISLNLFSQVVIITQNTTSPGVCDGSAYIDSMLIPFITPTSIWWSGNGSVIQQGGTFITNLCPGTYTVNYTSTSGNPGTSTFTIGSGLCNLTATLNVTNCTTSQSCDGTATPVPVGGTAPYTFMWSNGSTAGICQNLCAGQICCSIADANGCSITTCDIISTASPNAGDTLIITGGNCTTPIGTILTQVEDCLFDFNGVDTAYLSSVTLPTNPLDSMICYWVFVDTNGVMTTVVSYASPVNASGCYDFTLILFCSQKSLNIKTIIVNDNYELSLSGLSELNLERHIVKVFDMMGRESKLIENTLLIVQYSDGATERLMITK